MNIREEEKHKAFEARFFFTNGSLSKYGDFDFQPGEIVRKERSKQLVKHNTMYFCFMLKFSSRAENNYFIFVLS